MNLRDYQIGCVDAVFKEWKEHTSTLLVMPTGSGKTLTAAEIIRRIQPKRTLWITHRDELVWQSKRTIEQHTGLTVEIEMADLKADGLLGNLNVVIGTVQTLTSVMPSGHTRMSKFRPNEFGLVVCDESHHSVAPSWKNTLNYFQQNKDLRILGLTATPDRADEEALGQVYEGVAHDIEILDLIKEGWLVDVEQLMVPVSGLDYSHVRTTAGDLNVTDLSKITEREETAQRMCQPSLELIWNLPLHALDNIPTEQWGAHCTANGKPRRALMFCVSKVQAELSQEIFNRVVPGMANWVCDKTPKDTRRTLLREFSTGWPAVICNCDCLSEGFDDPGVEIIIMGRATKSRSKYAQFCLDSDTEILTKKGWRTHKTINQDDYVAAFNMETEMIEWVPIEDFVLRRLYANESLFGIKNPHLDIRVTNSHDMVVKMKRRRSRQETNWFKIPAGCIQKSFSVPCAGKPRYTKCELGITDDEIKFVAWMLTDGSINRKTKQACITQGEHQPWLSELENCLSGCGFKYSKRAFWRKTNYNQTSRCVRFTVSRGRPRGTGKHLRGYEQLESFLNKSAFPESLFQMSRRQVDIFLRTINLADGAKSSPKDWTQRSYHIVTSRKHFADSVQIMCVLNGLACNLSEVKNKRSPFWIMHIKPAMDRTIAIRSNDGRAVWNRVPFSNRETVWCVTNERGTIVTRRNGKVAIVGNCGRATRPLPGVVDKFDLATDRRAAIGASNKPTCLIVDFVGNSGRHKLVTSVDILGGNVSDDALNRATRLVKKLGQPLRVSEAIASAEKEIEDEKEKSRKYREAEHQKLVARAKFTANVVDPFDVFDIKPNKSRGWDAGKQLSEKQTALLLKQGINPENLPYSMGKQLIGEIFKRWDCNQCSFKQARVLKRWGFPTDLTRTQAKAVLDQLAARQWRSKVGVVIPEPAAKKETLPF